MMINKQLLKFHYSDIHKNHPDEDSTVVNDNIFAVFDGVTLAFQDPYPNPSPAAQAAEIAAKSAVEKIKENSRDPVRLLKEALTYANQKVRKLNESLGLTPQTVDFLKKQYAATVGAFGFIKDEVLYFGQINDCGVMVFDPLGNCEVDFILNSKPLKNLLTNFEKKGKFVSGNREEHLFVRREVVNNPHIEINGERINFGVMTGEEKASQFFHYGCSHLFKGQLCLFYSDGFIPFIQDPGFMKLLYEAEDEQKLKDYIEAKISEDARFQKEKSLVVIKL